MYDFTDYLVASLSTMFVLFPTCWGLWHIMRAMFPQRKRHHHPRKRHRPQRKKHRPRPQRKRHRHV